MVKNFIYLLILAKLLFCCQANEQNSVVDSSNPGNYHPHKGALLSSSFQSYEAFVKEVDIQYSQNEEDPKVTLIHKTNGQILRADLTEGYSDKEIMKAEHEGLWKKIKVIFKEPMVLYYKDDFMKIWSMVRKRQYLFGADDVALFNLAEAMVKNIYEHDQEKMSEKDLSEKGYLNTFNHINGQALMTSIFSENFADYVADLHERGNMPELITGKFSNKQLKDLEFGPVDNYIDIINNEWGQELGKTLQIKYEINRHTKWTNKLFCDYINDLQAYQSWAFQISFKPFKEEDVIVKKFVKKLNIIMSGQNLVG